MASTRPSVKITVDGDKVNVTGSGPDHGASGKDRRRARQHGRRADGAERHQAGDACAGIEVLYGQERRHAVGDFRARVRQGQGRQVRRHLPGQPADADPPRQDLSRPGPAHPAAELTLSLGWRSATTRTLTVLRSMERPLASLLRGRLDRRKFTNMSSERVRSAVLVPQAVVRHPLRPTSAPPLRRPRPDSRADGLSYAVNSAAVNDPALSLLDCGRDPFSRTRTSSHSDRRDRPIRERLPPALPRWNCGSWESEPRLRTLAAAQPRLPAGRRSSDECPVTRRRALRHRDSLCAGARAGRGGSGGQGRGDRLHAFASSP